MTNENFQPSTPTGVEALSVRFYRFIDELEPGKRVGYALAWGFITVLLIVAASWPLPEGYRFVSAIAGAPAGIITFLLILGFIRSTKLRDTQLVNIRSLQTPKQRIPLALGILLTTVIGLILVANYIPLGLGGVIIIVAVLSTFNILRRTPQELYWSGKGFPDPRELGLIDEDERDEMFMVADQETGELTDRQKEYFEILESFDVSPKFQKSIDEAKQDLIKQNRRNETGETI